MGLYLKLTLVGIFAYTSLSATTKQLNYIDAYKHIAIQEMERTGIPASIKLAQALLESGSGTSYLAKEANNHFGIKCGGRWDGDVIYRKDDDYDKEGHLRKSCFRKYNNVKHSFQAHSAFLQKNRRYSNLFELKGTDYKGWARGLREAGYATNPKYSRLLISIIERYELYKYDAMTSDAFEDFEEFTELEIDIAASTPAHKQEEASAPIEVAVPKPAEQKEEIAEIVPTIKLINQSKMTLATGKESIKQIAHRTGTPAKAIVRFNEGVAAITSKPAAGERIYLQAKRTIFRGRKYSHTVADGESMYDIAQLYGIRLDKLYARNLMTEPAQATTGQIILLSGRRDRMPTLRRADTKHQAVTHVPTGLIEKIKEEYVDWEETTTSTSTTMAAAVTKPKTRLREKIEPIASASSPVTRPAPIIRPEPMSKPIVPTTYVVSAPKPKLPQAKQHASEVVHMEYYKVNVGDSLFAIARRYKLSLEKLKAWNGLRDNTIHLGQILRVE